MTEERPREKKSLRSVRASREGGARRRLGTEERRSQLLELGIDAFSREPYDAVSIEEVAARAGTSKGLLYHYFPTKRDFYLAAIAEVSKRLLASTDFTSVVDPLTRLAKGLSAYADFIDRHGLAYGALLRSGIGMDAQALAVIESTRGTFAARLIESFPGPVSQLARTALVGWIGFVEATSLDWVARRAVGRDDLIRLWSTTLVSLTEQFGMGATV